MSLTVEAASHAVFVITSSARGTGLMTLVPAKERDGKLVLSPCVGDAVTLPGAS